MTSGKKLLTICVPAYNVEEYIEKNLRSYEQELIRTRVEVLIINDGSSDRTKELAEQYSDKYPETYRVIDKENGGHGSTINRGIEEAKGMYFKVVDGDDWLTQTALIKLLRELEKSSADLVITDYQTIDKKSGDREVIRYCSLESGALYTIGELTQKKALVSMATACYKTEILLKHRVRLLEKTYYVDEQLNVQPFAFINTIFYMNLVLYNYLIGNQSQSMAIHNQIQFLIQGKPLKSN